MKARIPLTDRIFNGPLASHTVLEPRETEADIVWADIAHAAIDPDMRRIVLVDEIGEVQFHNLGSNDELTFLKSVINQARPHINNGDPDKLQYMDMRQLALDFPAVPSLIAMSRRMHLRGKIHRIFIFSNASHYYIGAQRMQSTYQLTRRETEILAMLAEGLSAAEITGHLAVSLPTVRSHIQNLFKKLGIRNQQQAVKMVITAAYL